MEMAAHLVLEDPTKILCDTIAWGGRMLTLCAKPRIVLGVFSNMLPSVQGVGRLRGAG